MDQQSWQRTADEQDYVWTFKGERILLKGREIWYVHTEQRKLFIHTRDHSYQIAGNLKEAVERLRDLPMVKTHSAYLVRLDCLEAVSIHHAVLKNGAVLPVSERCWKQLRPVLEERRTRRMHAKADGSLTKADGFSTGRLVPAGRL